jgi:predicted class III extradiol MEMO1 family dioxygenase
LTVKSADELTKARDALASKARDILGMHPVTLAYFVRSADCSFWNAAEISKSKHDSYIKELSTTELSDVYLVDNQETKNGFGGPGIQVVHRNKGKFLLMAFGVEPDPCHPANGATVYR